MKDKIEALAKYLGYALIGIFIIVLVAVVSNYTKGYVKPDNTQHYLDSLQFQIDAAKKDKINLNSKLDSISKSIRVNDSLYHINQVNVNYEIKKLHNADNKFILAIGDSILRAKGAR